MVYTDALQSIAMIVGLVVCISFAVAKLDGESGMLAPPSWRWRTLRFERDVGVVYICVCVTVCICVHLCLTRTGGLTGMFNTLQHPVHNESAWCVAQPDRYLTPLPSP